MDKIKYSSREEIMTLPSFQRKKYFKKLKSYKIRMRKKEKKEEGKSEGKNKW